MILKCYLVIFDVQSKEKNFIRANIFQRKCIYKAIIEQLIDTFNFLNIKRVSAERKTSHIIVNYCFWTNRQYISEKEKTGRITATCLKLESYSKNQVITNIFFYLIFA